MKLFSMNVLSRYLHEKMKFPIVTDRENSIVNAPVELLHCWNHVFKDIKLCCRKHGLIYQCVVKTCVPFFIQQVKMNMNANFKKRKKKGILCLTHTT